MRRTAFCLTAACVLSTFASTAWAGPTDVSVTIFGSVSGRDGTDGSDYSVTPGSQIDLGPTSASVLSYSTSGGDAVNRGGLSASAFVVHPPGHGEPELLGIDLQGSLTAARQPTGGVSPGGLPSYFSAGSMNVGVAATAEYHDELTIVPQISGDIYEMQGIVYLQGFAALDAVATGGIDPNNVRASISGKLTTGDGLDSPTIFGTMKKATGEILVPSSPDSINILDYNPAFAFTYDFVPGVPFPIALELEMTGAAEFGDGSSVTLSPGFAFASFEAHFSKTLRWGGITKIINRRTGEELTDYAITSASGFDYTQTFPIPEPDSLVMLLIGLGGFACWRGRGRKRNVNSVRSNSTT